MAKLVLPRVHVMVLCDEIEPSPTEDNVFDLRGVRTHIAAPAFPYTHAQLCLYLQMTGHEGTATGRVVILDPETNRNVDETADDSIQFHGPLEFIHVPWKLNDCTFPEPGVYYVQVHFDGKLISERPLFLLRSEAVTGNGQPTF
jgi:uncharacterized protein DUF6941